MKIRSGMWTPAAGVMCTDCSSPVMLDAVQDGEAATLCDLCKQPIAVRDDVAQLHNIALELNAQGIPEAHMEQTGGMCAALALRMEGGTLVGSEWGYSFHPGKTWEEGEGEDAIEIVADDDEIVSLVLSSLGGASC